MARTVIPRLAVAAAIVAVVGLASLTFAPTVSRSAPASRTITYTLAIGEGKVITEVQGKDELTGEFHRWEPAVLVAYRGDTVVINVTNPRKRMHQLSVPEFAVSSKILEPRGGRDTVRFVANKTGVFPFVCGLDNDEGKGYCDVDHKYQVGHLIVLER